MEQTNMVTAMLQTVANTTELPKTGKGGGTDEFQKLLEEKSQAKDPLVEDQPKTQAKPQTPAKKTEKAPAQKQESALERAKKLAEQGAWFTQPDIGCVDVDLVTGEVRGTYEPGEYILAHIGGQTEIIPIADLEPWEQLQLQQLLANSGQTIDVSDPEADALLEATAPGADNSPAAMLEKLADEEIGQVAQTAVEEVKPQDEDDDQVELVDVEQGSQRIFHDVEAAPVKVGEAEGAEQTNEADVVRQVNDQIAQLIQSGESTVTVRLNPENLGEVTVQVSMKSDGVLNVAISARNDDTRALLERHAANLQEMVSSRTQQSVEVNVQRQQESQQNQNQQNYDGHNGHAQDGRERRQRQQHTSPEDFMQQLRLGLIPTDGEI
ncbi:MAG: flagellar hook-length control protein FliK [Clostridiales bacterium]|nr:flagellar hook-length control protein FliK [Clostridiales bacterium]